ncbi:DUF1810 domain-containing protein [Sphingomonas baiyangensis]|uniref:DUF1810 domain-containing protein n=1 Tax=Sphingomonas baiyangensis TaxID=2572576 RepID=A0A4U1L2I1_9SPHN|nr:DUF1810 domain-containing protein [Sphingomonas baiyangensis]TKD50420.1 DUF1810 domain-containing protein [Sphingomonas baiyangensis]
MPSFDLDRFVTAQEGVWPQALAELRAGRKRSHWMWFVFPQIAGLGRSPMAVRYALASREEAAAYLARPLLGGRYRAAVAALLALDTTDAKAILGAVDAMKLRSSLTLFHAASDDPLFAQAIDRFFATPDAATLRLL